MGGHVQLRLEHSDNVDHFGRVSAALSSHATFFMKSFTLSIFFFFFFFFVSTEIILGYDSQFHRL